MKNKVYLILYYMAFILTFSLCINTINNIGDQIVNFGTQNFYNYRLLILFNAILFVLFTIGIIRQKNYKNNNIIIPTCYLVFYIIIIIICMLYDKVVIIPYLHYAYYEIYLLFAYLLLNIYSLLGFDIKIKKRNKKLSKK